MNPLYRILTGLVVLGLGLSFLASFFGWGLQSDASARARSVRQGGVHGRRFMGGGTGWGK